MGNAVGAPKKLPNATDTKGKQRAHEPQEAEEGAGGKKMPPKGPEPAPSKHQDDDSPTEDRPKAKPGMKKGGSKSAAKTTKGAPPLEPKVKAKAPKSQSGGGKASTLLETPPLTMGRMKPMGPPKKAKRVDSSDEGDEPQKMPEVRRGGPFRQVVRVVLNSRKVPKKTSARKGKQVKSQAVVPSSEDESAASRSESEYEGDQNGQEEVPPLIKARSRTKSEPSKEPTRKKDKVRIIPPIPENAIRVTMKCGPCDRRGTGCYFESGPVSGPVARVCWECKNRKVKCWTENPELVAKMAHLAPTQPAAFPNAPYSFLEAELGACAERLRVIKTEGTPAPAIEGEEVAEDLTTVGDLFVHVVGLVRQLNQENAELRRDIQSVGVQLLALDARQAQSHQQLLGAILGLGGNGIRMASAAGDEVAAGNGALALPLGKKPDAPGNEEVAPKQTEGSQPPVAPPSGEQSADSLPKAAAESTEAPIPIPDGPLTSVNANPLPEVSTATMDPQARVDMSLVMDDIDNGSQAGGDEDAQGEQVDEGSRSPVYLAPPSPMPSTPEGEGPGSISQAEGEEAPPKPAPRGRGRKARPEQAEGEAALADREPAKKKRKVDDEGPEVAEDSPKKRGRPPVAAKVKGGAPGGRKK